MIDPEYAVGFTAIAGAIGGLGYLIKHAITARNSNGPGWKTEVLMHLKQVVANTKEIQPELKGLRADLASHERATEEARRQIAQMYTDNERDRLKQ